MNERSNGSAVPPRRAQPLGDDLEEMSGTMCSITVLVSIALLLLGGGADAGVAHLTPPVLRSALALPNHWTVRVGYDGERLCYVAGAVADAGWRTPREGVATSMLGLDSVEFDALLGRLDGMAPVGPRKREYSIGYVVHGKAAYSDEHSRALVRRMVRDSRDGERRVTAFDVHYRTSIAGVLEAVPASYAPFVDNGYWVRIEGRLFVMLAESSEGLPEARIGDTVAGEAYGPFERKQLLPLRD